MKALALLLSAYNAPTGFTSGSRRVRLHPGVSTRTNSRPMVMQEEEPEKRRDADGGIFTAQEFEEYYAEGWEEKWKEAIPAGDVKFIKDLNIGDAFPKAKVLAYTDAAAFMEIGAEVNGYLHTSRIPTNVWESLDEGIEIDVKIEKIDEKKGQIALTTGEPGVPVRDDIKYLDQLNVGDVIEEAYVNRCADFGAFMDIGAETDALCHVSKIPPSVWNELNNGDTMKVVIEKVDIEKGQVGVRHPDVPAGKGKGKGRGGRR